MSDEDEGWPLLLLPSPLPLPLLPPSPPPPPARNADEPLGVVQLRARLKYVLWDESSVMNMIAEKVWLHVQKESPFSHLNCIIFQPAAASSFDQLCIQVDSEATSHLDRSSCS